MPSCLDCLPGPVAVRTTLGLFVAGLVGCAATAPVPLVPSDVPAAIRAPQGQPLFLEALATGVQIYECVARGEAAAGYGWVFRAPESALTDRAGRPLGTHYAGPTWESVDGSKVSATVVASDPGSTPSAIPWLLLTVKMTSGAGVLTQTKSIQRLQTVGGVAPAKPCSADTANQTVRVPYTATYRFYRPAPT